MTTKLYVTNLSASATLSSVRQLFNACGEVVDVEFLAERSARSTNTAYVTMGAGVNAARTVERLHGTLLHDRVLGVTVARESSAADRREQKKNEAAPGVKIAQQYRDRHGMSYELDLEGLRLTLKFVFPEQERGPWRVRAAIANEQAGDVEVSAASRELALTALSEQCGQAPSSQLAAVRWLEVAAALKAVRAI